MTDLIRIGTYTGTEGTFTNYRRKYEFGFFLNQISDMRQLLSRVMEREFDHKLRVQFSSKELYDKLVSLGFNQFHATDWNIPNLSQFGELGRKEYARAIVDSLGNVDVDEHTPYVRLHSGNNESIKKFQRIFGGVLTGPYEGYTNLTWKGTNAIDFIDYMDWKFYNRRNRRGSELIKAVRWEDYLI